MNTAVTGTLTVWPTFEADFNSFAYGIAWTVASDAEVTMWGLRVGSPICIQDFEHDEDSLDLRSFGVIASMRPAAQSGHWVIYMDEPEPVNAED